MTATSDQPISLHEAREREFSGLTDCVYLNAASIGPLAARAKRELDRYSDLRSRIHRMRDEDFISPLVRARSNAAALLGASTDEIALVPSTSFGINLAALGFSTRTGARVLVSDREFPANVYPWMDPGQGRLEIVPTDEDGWPDEDRIVERLTTGDVAVLSVSSVQFSDGFRADLHRLGEECRQRGVLFVVDGIQSLGQLAIDVGSIHVDVVATGGHKWLCGPQGAGFAFVRRGVQEEITPRAIGWASMLSSEDLQNLLDYRWQFLPDARRYELGTLPAHDYAALAASLDLLLEVGPDVIARHVDRLLDPLRAWLREADDVVTLSCMDPARRSGILSFRTPDSRATYRRLRAGTVVSSLREGAIRLSAHLYNTVEEIARVIDILDAHRRTGWR